MCFEETLLKIRLCFGSVFHQNKANSDYHDIIPAIIYKTKILKTCPIIHRAIPEIYSSSVEEV